MKNNKKLDYLVSILNQKNSYYNDFLNNIQMNNLYTQQISINKCEYKNNYNLTLNTILNSVEKNSIDSNITENKRINTNKREYIIDANITENKHIKNDKLINSNTIIDDIFITKLYKFIDNKESNLFNTYQTIRLLSNEPILVGICIIIFDDFLSFNSIKQLKFMKELKFKLGIDLDKKNLYEKFNYRYVRFKKSDFQNALIENKIIDDKYFYKYLGDYFDLNIVIINNKNIDFINTYSKERYTIAILDDGNYYIEYNLDGIQLVMDKNIKLFNINNDKYKSKKLDELQLIATKLKINILKEGKKKLIKKTKKELIEEIDLKKFD